jgi:hypothetical protein
LRRPNMLALMSEEERLAEEQPVEEFAEFR